MHDGRTCRVGCEFELGPNTTGLAALVSIAAEQSLR
jgi:hypothetical protein